jgi:hypothetical protein
MALAVAGCNGQHMATQQTAPTLPTALAARPAQAEEKPAPAPPAAPERKKEYYNPRDWSWQDKIGVSITSVKAIPVRVTFPNGVKERTKVPFVVVTLSIWNKSVMPFDYQHPPGEAYTLTDDVGNPFAPENAQQQFIVEGEKQRAVIKPEEFISDQLVFSVANLRKGQKLILTLAAKYYGGANDEVVKFVVDQAEVTDR